MKASRGGRGEKRRSREEIAALVREFRSSGLTQRKFCEDRGLTLSVLQRSLKIERRSTQPKLMAVQIEAAEQDDPRLGGLIWRVSKQCRKSSGLGTRRAWKANSDNSR